MLNTASSLFYIFKGVRHMAGLERDFQAKLIRELKQRYPDAIISKVDTGIQGFPDILILQDDTWAALECKKGEGASHRPNQDYYVNKLNGMSFSSFIYPENKEEVLSDLEAAFKSRRKSRASRSK